MAESSEVEVVLDPVKASTLLDLEQGRISQGLSAEAARPGIWIRGLDTRFRTVWRGGRVIGIGTDEAIEDRLGRERSLLSLHLISAALLSRPNLSQLLQTTKKSAEASSPDAVEGPTIYVIAPHTNQTIPLLHGHLARTLSDSPAAIELLKRVQVLQYFDFAGLAEAVAEVGEAVYRRTQQTRELQEEHKSENNGNQVMDVVLIQGLGQTVTSTYRRSGVVHVNALLANLTRNIVQLSRISADVLVLVDVSVEFDSVKENNTGLEASRRFATGMELESAFSGPSGEHLRLICGNESLSRTLETAFDCLVAVHDGLGRVKDRTKQPRKRQQVVEVLKDRLGDTTGLWAVWTTNDQT
ncbi:hypothetical protein LTR47_010808 [Exophiala xenobiotica]|nr:hypothetical protein LTR41_007592 [Exophiala xenobiotica]KAK5221621.1 hypothetical protein LTR47_010808 [Exophiala xenobiotica]KAK5245728.1 hypothetical protein LTS06_008862 [Exophiala xenobiotica]KAK5257264.1 hypothetical protein LTR40_009683 [Exophiala xenobiotica]KAK5320653.1 hypothetical protein LTR93_006865 [Exophiala xenobiotica]